MEWWEIITYFFGRLFLLFSDRSFSYLHNQMFVLQNNIFR